MVISLFFCNAAIATAAKRDYPMSGPMHDLSFFLSMTFLFSLQRNVKAMSMIRESLSMLGFRSDQLNSVFRILAAIIQLGDVDFTSSNDEESNTEKVVVQAKDKLRDGEDQRSPLYLSSLKSWLLKIASLFLSPGCGANHMYLLVV